MGLLQDAGYSVGSTQSATGGGFLQQAGITSITQNTRRVDKSKKPAEVDRTVQRKQDFLKNAEETKREPTKITGVDFGRLWDATKQGASLIPSQLKVAGGIILSSLNNTNIKINKFFEPVSKFNDKFRFDWQKEIVQKNRVAKEIGQKETEKFATNLREQGQKGFEDRLKEISANTTPSDGIQSYLEMAAFNIPQMAATTGLTLATAIVTRNPWAASAVGVSSSYGLGASEVYSTARSEGLSDSDAMPLAEIGGVIIGAIDFLPLSRLVRKSGSVKVVQKSITRKIAQSVVSLGTQAGFEGITEGAQEIVSNAISRTYNEQQDLFEGVKESVVVGALLGGFVDVTTSGVMSALGNQASPQETIDHINEKFEEILSKPENKRTLEEKAIVEVLSERVITPDEAIAMVVDSGLQETEVGKSLILKSMEAKDEGANVRIRQSWKEKTIDIEVVDQETYTPPVEEPSGREVDDTLLTSEEAQKVESQDTEQAKKARKELEQIEQNKQERVVENDSKKEILDNFSSEQVKGIRAIKRGIEIRESKGQDPTTVSELPSYKKHIEDVMAYLGTNSEDEAIAFIRDKFPDPTRPVQTREEKTKERETKSRIKPKTVEVPSSNLPKGQGKPKVSRLEARMKGVVGNATKEQIDALGLSTYNTLNKKETIERAIEYVTKNEKEALEVLQDKRNAPTDIPSTAIYVALTQVAKGDITLATKLASLKATALGQEISILSELDPNSPVKLMNEIVEIRRKAFDKKYKNRSEKEVRKGIKDKIKSKVKAPAKSDWNAFINSIEC